MSHSEFLLAMLGLYAVPALVIVCLIGYMFYSVYNE